MTRLVALVAALLLLVVAAPAAGGGWAVTTLDAVPDRFEAGRAYDIGYTIRQHGVTPVDLASTGIRVTSGAPARTVTFDGRRDGAVGHYVVRVTFPAAGEWRWEALQDWFGPQPLGTVSVAAPALAQAPKAPAGAVAPVTPAEPAPSAALIVGLLIAVVGAAVLFGGSLATATRARL